MFCRDKRKKLFSDKSQRSKIVKEVIRSDGLWCFACGDVLPSLSASSDSAFSPGTTLESDRASLFQSRSSLFQSSLASSFTTFQSSFAASFTTFQSSFTSFSTFWMPLLKLCLNAFQSASASSLISSHRSSWKQLTQKCDISRPRTQKDLKLQNRTNKKSKQTGILTMTCLTRPVAETRRTSNLLIFRIHS